MAGLTNAVLAERRLAAITMRSQTVVYTQRTRTTNKQTGAISDVDVPTTIDTPGALIASLEQEFVDRSGGKYTLQDRRFRILATEIPEQPPVKSGIITFDGSDYQISEWQESADLSVWDIIGKKL